MEYSTEPGIRHPPGFLSQIQLSIAPHQPTAPQEVRSQLIDLATNQEIGHISITIDEHTLDQGPLYRPAIVTTYLEDAYQHRGLSPYMVYNLCQYLIHRYNTQYPRSTEQYSKASHICVEIDASDGYWGSMGGRTDYDPNCEMVLKVDNMLNWANAKLHASANRKKSARIVRTSTGKSKTRRGTSYSRDGKGTGRGRGKRKPTRQSHTKKDRRRRRQSRSPTPRRPCCMYPCHLFASPTRATARIVPPCR